MAHSSSVSAMGILGCSQLTPWPDARPLVCRKVVSAYVPVPGTLCLCQSRSARRATSMPASVCTRWTLLSSSKGVISRVPCPGPRQRMSMTRCQMKVFSHLTTVSCCTSGGSQDSRPASCTRPGVRPLMVTPSSCSVWEPPIIVAMPESAASSFPRDAQSSFSVLSSAVRMEPSSPSRPSMMMAGVGWKRPAVFISLMSCFASWIRLVRPLVLIVQYPFILRAFAMSSVRTSGSSFWPMTTSYCAARLLSAMLSRRCLEPRELSTREPKRAVKRARPSLGPSAVVRARPA
mmetsp:Transcript_95045/g.252435  ORF Transcript_95045/g.252435 Transcript_95045/m.252435 type:complete len:290 (-) Transcript_95045:1-870(-)